MEIPHPTLSTMDSEAPAVAGPERLWTPWRMDYVGGARKHGCVFCNRLAAKNDMQSLILHRGHQAFVIMNLFPYNTGHVMIVPNAHVPSPEAADPVTLSAMAVLQIPVLRAIRRALGCDGFNLGSNLGAVAGAGIVEHFHHHVVPRWIGDANFMPVLAATKALPELLPVTYAKLRAELAREHAEPAADAPAVIAVALTADATRVLMQRASGAGSWRLPSAVPAVDESCWRATLQSLGNLAADARLIGWAGAVRADASGRIALTFQLRREPTATDLGSERDLIPIAAAPVDLPDPDDGAALAAAVRNLAPTSE